MRVTRILIFVLLAATLAGAQASRTWVSGVGDDVNPCSRTAPCKTFAGAISKTAAGGEIDALDPAGYGAVTITKAITIDGGGGQVASVLVSGTNGIVVQAGPSDVVILRNLRINGIGTGINGIRFLSGRDLNVENCYIFGFTTNGVDIALNQATQGSAHVLNTVVKNVGGTGVAATNTVTPQVRVGIDNSAMILTNKGVEAGDHSRVVVNRSVIENAASIGANSTASAGDSILTLDHSDISYNGTGTSSTGGGLVVVADNKFSQNGTNASGQCQSYGTNRFDNNNQGTCVPIPTGQQ